ncbi:hypothetical protein [Salsipaludibacter albus]|uniref:hypothetical protein n=1 Tax=Salsipaludibacter albus TaxID=2849650 RepID=UPI001EE46241|nr:hypothetical protein [Salsipaludibacter albus]MBY5163608.1 hypothetical protein [Salsipaludibacter albus]
MKKLLTVAVAAVAALTFSTAASANHDIAKGDPVSIYKYDLDTVQPDDATTVDDGLSGRAMVKVKGDQVTVMVKARGFEPGQLVHAQHLHGDLAGGNECPTVADDADMDGLISTVEGIPSYGGVKVSLTTSGDTSSASALAVDRFPVADADGEIDYKRTFTAEGDLLAGIGNLHVVLHGLDLNDSGAYDFEAGTSSLNPELPLEATIPALCGGPLG